MIKCTRELTSQRNEEFGSMKMQIYTINDSLIDKITLQMYLSIKSRRNHLLKLFTISATPANESSCIVSSHNLAATFSPSVVYTSGAILKSLAFESL